MSSSPNFCRLCLQKLTGPSRVLNRDLEASSMVKHLFPGMEINLMKVPKLCTECFKYIQFAYTMRETVIKNEQKINSNMAGIQISEKNTCRLCLNTDVLEATVFLYDNVNQTMSFMEARSIIEIAIVDMRFEIFKKPVVCDSCWQIVRSIYLFKKRCFATEKILKFYCKKNNLTSLTNTEIEAVSNCYYSNLKKFSRGEKYELGANLNKGNGPEVGINSVDNIIKPIDVYLNNFTTDDEDDTFEEEMDDIFVESPKTVKTEPSEPLVVSLKEEGGKGSSILDQTNDNIERIAKALGTVKEQEKSLNVNPKDIIRNDDGDAENLHRNDITVDNSGAVLNESFETNNQSTKITYAKRKKKVTKNKKKSSKSVSRETVNSTIGSIEKSSENFSEIENITNDINDTIEYSNLKHNKELRISKDKCKNIENQDKEILEQVNENHETSQILQRVQESRKPFSNFKKVENQEKLLKDFVKKRKNQSEKSEDRSNLKNITDNHKETLRPVAEKRKNRSEIIKDIELPKNVEQNCKEIEENQDTRNAKNILKPVIKRKTKGSDDSEWFCDKCDFKTKYKHHLKRHSLVHNKTGTMLICPKCMYSTHIQRNLDRHMLIHTSENFIKCAVCTYSTVNKYHLKNHMLIHEKSNSSGEVNPKKGCASDETTQLKPWGFRCQDCPFVTSKETQIIAHLRTHKSQEKIFKCSECHYITTRTHSLKDHMELHNEDSSKKKFKCKLCSFTGKKYTHLVSHTLTHQKEFKFKCSKCSYKAKRKSHLVTHMLRHQSDDKKVVFQCPYCKYKSIRREHLKSHCRNVHYDKEEVDCNEAEITVRDDRSSSNTDKKIVKCPYCSYRNPSASLEVHIFTAHFPSDSSQMECNDCSYKTDRRVRFLKHINLHKSREKTK